jgi:hypothetical protein
MHKQVGGVRSGARKEVCGGGGGSAQGGARVADEEEDDDPEVPLLTYADLC